MFMNEAAANMLSLVRSLKEHNGNLLHVMYKIHALNLTTKLPPKCYARVNALIAYTKAMFLNHHSRLLRIGDIFIGWVSLLLSKETRQYKVSVCTNQHRFKYVVLFQIVM